ncbi:MAG: RNA polymerase sigma factor [Janthinobacterium lividum]
MTSIERCGLILVSDTEQPATSRPGARPAARPAVNVESLVLVYSTLLFRVAHAVLRSAPEAEDAVQDAFLRVLAHQAKLPEIVDLRVWLVRIVWRLALDRKRKATPIQMDEAFARSLVAQHLPADQALAESRELHRVLLEMERLPVAEKHVLLLCAVEEMQTAEIAGVLGKSESAVRSLLFRARTRLRERLESTQKGRR